MRTRKLPYFALLLIALGSNVACSDYLEVNPTLRLTNNLPHLVGQNKVKYAFKIVAGSELCGGEQTYLANFSTFYNIPEASASLELSPENPVSLDADDYKYIWYVGSVDVPELDSTNTVPLNCETTAAPLPENPEEASNDYEDVVTIKMKSIDFSYDSTNKVFNWTTATIDQSFQLRSFCTTSTEIRDVQVCEPGPAVERPGCWCNVPFYGRKCCWCTSHCYYNPPVCRTEQREVSTQTCQ